MCECACESVVCVRVCECVCVHAHVCESRLKFGTQSGLDMRMRERFRHEF